MNCTGIEQYQYCEGSGIVYCIVNYTGSSAEPCSFGCDAAAHDCVSIYLPLVIVLVLVGVGVLGALVCLLRLYKKWHREEVAVAAATAAIRLPPAASLKFLTPRGPLSDDSTTTLSG